MNHRKYEVTAYDKDGNIWIVGSDNKEAAFAIAQKLKDEGYLNVSIKER